MTDTVSSASLQEWIRAFARLVAENRDHLTDLDAAIGDGDHGANMKRGFEAVLSKLGVSDSSGGSDAPSAYEPTSSQPGSQPAAPEPA